VRNTPDHPPLADLWRKQQAIDDWYIAWSEKLTDSAMDEKRRFTLIGGNQGVMTCGETLLNIVTHTNYHRDLVVDLFSSSARSPAGYGSSGVAEGESRVMMFDSEKENSNHAESRSRIGGHQAAAAVQ
jgi:uncharacterized damage-inducible protein DinB